MQTNNIYLKFIDFIDVSNWSVQYLKWTVFSYNKNFELVKIWDFLTRNKTQVDIEDWKEYKRVTIKMNNLWIFLRDIEKWENIWTKKQFLVKKWQFLLSKIDARWGAFWVIPDEVDWAIITWNFWTFDVDYSKVNPHFLSNLVTTKEFLLFCENASNWTTNRHYLQEEAFLNEKIPLPSLEEQNRIIEEYNKKLKDSEKALFKAESLEKEIENYLMEELGIEFSEKNKKKVWLSFIDFKSLSRWDLSKNLSSWKSIKYENILFKDIIVWDPMYWANVSWVDKKSETRYIRITDINESWELNNDFVSPETIEEKFILKENDFLIARSWNTVWKTFLYKENFWRAMFAWYLVKYILDTTLAIPEYILYYTKSINFKKWIEANQRISGQPNINWQEYLYSPFVLPPLEIQEKIVKHIWELKDEIKTLKKLSEDLKESAKIEFEKEIFS